MDKLILDLLSFTRITRARVSIEPVNVERLIGGIIREREELQPPRAEIELKKPLLRVAGNEACLTQCITNLLDNAVKFVASGVKPKVQVYTEPKDKGVRIWIEDNGIGISPKVQHRLFQMFERVHDTTYPGTGIGLALVRKSIRRINGEVGVESEPGKGSRFWLELPRAEL